jgi:hypothetical protein
MLPGSTGGISSSTGNINKETAMSMGAIVSIHEVVEDKVIKKVLGNTAEKAIDAVKAFAEKYRASSDDILEKVYESDPDELAYYCEFEDEEQYRKDYDELAKALAGCSEEFLKATGLKGLYLVFNKPEDCYDDIDGFVWALPHSSIYGFTPEFQKFKTEFNTDTTWSQVVKFG